MDNLDFIEVVGNQIENVPIDLLEGGENVEVPSLYPKPQTLNPTP